MIWAVVFVVLLLGLIAVLNGFFPGMLGDEDRQISLTHNVLLLALLGGSLILGYRGRAHVAVKHALVWIAIALVLVLVYSYRDSFSAVVSRVSGELMPARPQVTPSGDVELRASQRGHFLADARIDGVPVRLMVDTGATMLALAPDDAERIGFDLDILRYSQPVNTANGRTYVAVVDVDRIEIGPIRFFDLKATVHRDGLEQSLLGMNVLDRLSGFERAGDRLILKP